MVNRPYVVEVRQEIEYLEQVIREVRWQHDAAYNTCRLMEETFEILVSKCRIVTYSKAMRGGRAHFTFNLNGSNHRRGEGYTLTLLDHCCQLQDLASARAEHKQWRRSTSWGGSGWSPDEGIPAESVFVDPIHSLNAEPLLEAIHELSVREVMSF